MKSTKALLLIAFLATTSASGSSEESNEEVLYEGGRRASPVEECFCLARHPMMVPVVDYLDSDNHGLRRLVVYLYKDQKTEKIHIYVPGVENQRKFPDVTLDLYGNEIFVVSNELTVTSVFEKSKNVIPLSVPTKPHQEPTVHEVPAVEPEMSPHQLLIYDFSNGNVQTHTESSLKTHTQIYQQSQPQIHTQTHQTHSHIHSQNYIPAQSQIHTQTHTQSYSQSHPQISQSHAHPQNDNNGHSKSSSIGGKFHYVYNSINANDKDILDNIPPSLNPHLTHYETYQYPTPPGDHGPDISFPTDSVPAEIETIAADGSVSSNEGSWSSPGPPVPSHPVGDEGAISAKRVSTAFDVWFKGQIKKVRDEQLTEHYVLDVKTLKANVEKILQENHIKITANGKLQDADGHVMSFSRLKLRPVLIGDSVGYEKVKHRNTFAFPKDLTYLEAILISVSYPPKILGIVPLRKVTLQQISQGTLNPTETVAKSVTSKNKTSSTTNSMSDKNNINHDKSDLKQQQRQKETSSKKDSQNKNNIVGKVKKQYNISFEGTHGLPSPADLEDIFGKPPSKVSKQKSSNKTKTTTEAAAIDGRKSLNSNEIDERVAVMGRNGNRRDSIDIFKSLLSQTLGRLKDFFPISLPSESVEKEEENSTEDPLGFRIIGGDPATISGKMLNSRGRSGFIY